MCLFPEVHRSVRLCLAHSSCLWLDSWRKCQVFIKNDSSPSASPSHVKPPWHCSMGLQKGSAPVLIVLCRDPEGRWVFIKPPVIILHVYGWVTVSNDSFQLPSAACLQQKIGGEGHRRCVRISSSLFIEELKTSALGSDPGFEYWPY